MIKCNRDCQKCRSLSGRVDDKGYPFGYPFGYECMKHGDTVEREQFTTTKYFAETEDDYEGHSLKVSRCK